MTKEQHEAMKSADVCRECLHNEARPDGFCSDVCRDAWDREFAAYYRKVKTLGDILIESQRQMLAWKQR